MKWRKQYVEYRQFIGCIQKNPSDDNTIATLCDWLEDHIDVRGMQTMMRRLRRQLRFNQMETV